MKRYFLIGFSCLLALGHAQAAEANRPYVVVAAAADLEQEAWQEVAETLVEKHRGELLTFDAEPGELLESLRERLPGKVCFVAPHERAGRNFVKAVHLLSRQIDDDPYADFSWGIVTGYDAANALEIAKTDLPLVVRKVASGTEVALDRCEEGIWYCELKQGHMVRKAKGGKPVSETAPPDTTSALVDSLNVYQADLFVTSGHATERDWQIGFRYRNGTFRSEEGQLYGLDTEEKRHPIDSPNPKVYLPIGNCLMGHVDGQEAMALAFMNSAGVRQMVGYTVPTWYGYAGWGCLDYFVEQPGRYDFVGAFFANQHALVHRLETCFPGLATAEVDFRGRTETPITATKRAVELGLRAQDAVGLLFDRDVVALYGDPGWEARMAPGDCAYDQELTREGDVFTLTVTPRAGAESFYPVNENGAQRGWRPIVQFLPGRFRNLELLEGEELAPLLADDFVLVPNPRECDPERIYRVKFRAEAMEGS